MPRRLLLTLLFLVPVASWAGICVGYHGEPGGADARVQASLTALGDPSWEVRAGATRWLIEHHHLWARSIADDWRPRHPEASWRWRHIRETVSQLGNLPSLLEAQNRATLTWTIRRLHQEAGTALVEALAGCLRSQEPRIRRRAVELLVALPGIDLEAQLAKIESDPSPWVRRSLYQVALWHDRRWASRLLERAMARVEGDSLRIETVRAVKTLGDPQWVGRLLDEWHGAGVELKAELAVALHALGAGGHREVLAWMLASERYPLVIRALSQLDHDARAADVAHLVPLLEAPEAELRQRALAIVRRVGDAGCALDVLPLLDSDDPKVLRFAAETLVSWKAEDYYGELDATLRRLPAAERFLCIVSRDGQAVAVPAPARLDSVDVIPALEPKRR